MTALLDVLEGHAHAAPIIPLSSLVLTVCLPETTPASHHQTIFHWRGPPASPVRHSCLGSGHARSASTPEPEQVTLALAHDREERCPVSL